MTGALFGAAVGAVVGAVVLAAASTVSPSNLYAATAVRPAVVSASVPVSGRTLAQPQMVGAAYATQRAAYQGQQEILVQSSQTNVYSVAFVLFAAVAGAVNGLFLWNNRRVAMAATTGRREALMAGVAAASMTAAPAFAAYGEGANVFGKAKDVEQIFTVNGDGWTVEIPSKYNASKEREFDGMVARWEDNFDAVNNSFVLVRNGGSLGSLDEVRNTIVTPLLGKQAYEGESISEGGFAPGRYSSAAILDQKEVTKNGKTYYFYELLTRTADGNEGGRHQLFSVTASNGKLYVFKSQAGDKRWFKGLEKQLRASQASFVVA